MSYGHGYSFTTHHVRPGDDLPIGTTFVRSTMPGEATVSVNVGDANVTLTGSAAELSAIVGDLADYLVKLNADLVALLGERLIRA